jgi:hypothetical protein
MNTAIVILVISLSVLGMFYLKKRIKTKNTKKEKEEKDKGPIDKENPIKE